MTVPVSGPLTGWPSGRGKTILEIKTDPDEIAVRFSLTVTADRDDLDAYRGTHFFLEEIGPVVFLKYANAPKVCTVVLVDYGVPARLAQDAVLSALALDPHDVIWRSDEDHAGSS